MPKDRKADRRSLWLLLTVALLIRLVFGYATEGYPYDMSCFVAWGDRMVQTGPGAFYSPDYFADYPPGYLWVLEIVALLRMVFGLGASDGGTRLLLALVPALCDCAAAALVWLVGEKNLPAGNNGVLLAMTGFAAFNPLTLFNTGIWKQIDGAFALPLLLCFLLLEGKKHYLTAAVLYGIALAIKPQALLAGPVLAVCFLAGVADGAKEGKLASAVGRCFGGIAAALAPVMILGVPFFGVSRLLPGLIQKYEDTTAGYPYASINAFNWMAALGGNWQHMEEKALGILPWEILGTVHILLLTVALVWLAVRSWQAGRFSPLLLACFYLMGIFTLAHCMHERYMVAGVLLALLAAARWNDRLLYCASFGASLAGFVNLSAVYCQVGTNDEWLTSPTSTLVVRIVGFGETICFVLLALAVWEIAMTGSTLPLATPVEQHPHKGHKKHEQETICEETPLPKWTWGEMAGLLALTAVTAMVSFAYLGSMTAPQNPLDATGTTQTGTVGVEEDTSYLWVYTGITHGGSLSVVDAWGEVRYTQELLSGGCFQWTRADFYATAGETFTVTVDNGVVYEMAFRRADNTLVPVVSNSALFDEQTMVPEKISQLNSMYFDEIYHGRTGYESLHRLPIYETTHPPLGKDFIMLGIALFGMTGFGWRCAGVLFGVLLVPLAWCFARRLTGKPWAGALAGVLLALDFMRYSQSRIATIDVYATFFILLSADFMLWYWQSVLHRGVCASVLPMALCGISFGLGCASKWTGIYAGAGLAVLYFWVLYLRGRQKPRQFDKEIFAALAGGVAFFVAVPLCIYFGSYLPYRWRNPNFGLKDWWDCQTLMYNYHAHLEATHPFESRWYTWVLNLRPVWYYRNGELPFGTEASIAGMGGPVIWLGGLACILVLLWRQCKGRGTKEGGMVLVLYGTQLIPWMLVSRCTFLYHYFPSSIFCLAALVLVLARMQDEKLAKKIAAGLVVASLVAFVWFFPVLSGLPIPHFWAESMKVLPSYGFY